MSSVLTAAMAFAKRVYGAHSPQTYDVRLRRDLWVRLAEEVFEQYRVLPGGIFDKPYVVVIRNVRFYPSERRAHVS